MGDVKRSPEASNSFEFKSLKLRSLKNPMCLEQPLGVFQLFKRKRCLCDKTRTQNGLICCCHRSNRSQGIYLSIRHMGNEIYLLQIILPSFIN